MIEVARLHRFDNGSSLKAFADVIFNGQLLVKGVKVADGRNGLYVSMPSAQGKDGKWYPTVMLLEDSLKEELQTAVLEAYNV
ncbi:MAG: SpoVG family protein [Candidatus Omnitrophota bacterium]|nr:SpoVG family protein [Candidatus Omnitrophota bacterium]